MPTFYGAIDLSRNELRNAVVQNLGTAPATPTGGLLYFNSTDHTLYWFDGTSWVPAKGTGGTSTNPGTTVTNSAVPDTPVVGSSLNFAREDHRHGREGFGPVTAQVNFSLASGDGTATTVSHSDHTHGTMANPVPSGGSLGQVLTKNSATSGDVGWATPSGAPSGAAGGDLSGTYPNPNVIQASTASGFTVTNGRLTVNSPSQGNTGGILLSVGATTANMFIGSGALQLTPPSGGSTIINSALFMGANRISNMADPLVAQDAATKNYVDSMAAGLTWKQPVRVATTANLAALSGLLTVDGVTVAANDRVLVKNQTTQSANGIYVAASGAWTRATDADTSNELVNAAVFVSEGTTQADTAWVQTTNAPITVGTSNIVWVQFGAPASYIGGAGLTLTGNTFDVGQGTGIIVGADTVSVDSSVVALKSDLTGKVDTTRTLTAGAGLTGGGDLSANRTFDVVAGDTTLTVAADSVVVNTAVIATVASVNSAVAGLPHKFAAALTGTSSPEVVTHNLNTRDIQLTVLNGASPYTAVEVDWDATTVNTATIRYNPNLGAGYRVVIVG